MGRGGVLNVKNILREIGVGEEGGREGGDSFELRTHCVVSCKRLTKREKKTKEKKRGWAGGGGWEQRVPFDTWGGNRGRTDRGLLSTLLVRAV